MKTKLAVPILIMVVLLTCAAAYGQTWQELLAKTDSLTQAGDQDSAIIIAKLALEKTQAQFGGEDTASARVLTRLAICSFYKAMYDEAVSFSRRSLTIREKLLGPEHPDLAASLNNLGILLYNQGKYPEAESVHRRALAMREKVLGPEHPDVAASLNNLSVVFHDQGKYAEIEPLCLRAVAIWEKAFGSEHPIVANGLNTLTTTYLVQGRYSEAEAVCLRAIAIREKALGPDHPLIATSLNNLGLIYSEERKYAEAEKVSLRALAISEKTSGPEHPDVAECLDNLAGLYYQLDRFDEAEPLYKRSLAISEKVFGPESPNVALTLNNLAQLYWWQGRYQEAEPLLTKALSIRERTLGPEHAFTATSLYNLGNLHFEQGRHAEAATYYRKALTIRKHVFGPDHPLVAETREAYASYYRAIGQLDSGLSEAGQVLRIRLKNFGDNVIVLSEKDALSYSQEVRGSTGMYLSFLAEQSPISPQRLGEGCDAILKSKGIVSDGIIQRQRSLVTEPDSATQALAESWRSTRFQLSQLFVSGPGDDTTGAYRRELDSLGNLTNDLEAALARQSASFRKRQDYTDVSAARVQALLPEKSVLVEFLKYEYMQHDPDSVISRYQAMVLDKKQPPALIPLGDAAALDPVIERYSRHVQQLAASGRAPSVIDQSEYEQISGELYDRVWRPLESKIAGRKLVFVAPDGGLDRVSFAGLKAAHGKYLIERYTLHYLSSGRDLIRLRDEPAPTAGLLALGDPDYGASVQARRLQPTVMQPASVVTAARYATRNIRSGCGELKDLSVAPLPGTRREVEQIVTNWQATHPGVAVAYYGPEASEDNFKAGAPGKRVIHLATHGYFLEGRCQPSAVGKRPGSETDYLGENPLLLSGLLLAGANLHGAGADSVGAEDGILTAEEVAGMNLEGTRLVVLSACETGLGEVKAGEGVYGLRRAFQMAGARTVVSALWPVTDRETAELMAKLYQSGQKNLPERMRQVQLERIKILRASGQIDHPFTWAGFIALGDWR